MAWKELLQQQDKREADGELRSEDVLRAQGGLIRQVCGPEEPAPTPGLTETVVLPDGYVRRSQVQTYRTPPEYPRRRIRRAVLLVLGLCLLAGLVFVVLQSGWIF